MRKETKWADACNNYRDWGLSPEMEKFEDAHLGVGGNVEFGFSMISQG